MPHPPVDKLFCAAPGIQKQLQRAKRRKVSPNAQATWVTMRTHVKHFLSCHVPERVSLDMAADAGFCDLEGINGFDSFAVEGYLLP